MNYNVGDEIDNFEGITQLGSVHFHDLITGHWSMLFTYRQDFDPVVTTVSEFVTDLDMPIHFIYHHLHTLFSMPSLYSSPLDL